MKKLSCACIFYSPVYLFLCFPFSLSVRSLLCIITAVHYASDYRKTNKKQQYRNSKEKPFTPNDTGLYVMGWEVSCSA